MNIFLRSIGILATLKRIVMSLLLAGIAAGVGALASGIGAIGSSANNRKARDEESRSYREARNYLSSQYYRDPLSTVGNRSLLKSLDERMRDQQEALQNRAVAGGATVENQLAAMNSANRTMSGVYSNLLQGEDARRQAIDSQKMQLDMQHSGNIQRGYYQDAQNWQNWGAQMANAAMSFGTASLLNDKKG